MPAPVFMTGRLSAGIAAFWSGVSTVTGSILFSSGRIRTGMVGLCFVEPGGRCCQANSNSFLQSQYHCPLCCAKTAPLCESSGRPNVVGLTVDPHKNLVAMSSPVRVTPHPIDRFSADFGCKQRTKPVPQKSNVFVPKWMPRSCNKSSKFAEEERNPATLSPPGE